MISFSVLFYFEKKMLFKGCPHTQEHPFKTGTFIKYYKISQLIHTQSIAN